jgi:hypothetical protein
MTNGVPASNCEQALVGQRDTQNSSPGVGDPDLRDWWPAIHDLVDVLSTLALLRHIAEELSKFDPLLPPMPDPRPILCGVGDPHDPSLHCPDPPTA